LRARRCWAEEPWAFRGEAQVAAALEERAVAEWRDAFPQSEEPVRLMGPVVTPLFAATVPEVGDQALLFLARFADQPSEVVLFTVTPDGKSPAEPLEARPGWAVYERRVGKQVPDLVHVYDGDGRLVVNTPLQLGCAKGQCGREPVEVPGKPG
jgi:hypothetical protein